jgi:hypothetical protein
MNKNQIRNLAISLLDDEHGISENGYNKLREVLVETENLDIVRATDAANGRYFISEDSAEYLKTVENL